MAMLYICIYMYTYSYIQIYTKQCTKQYEALPNYVNLSTHAHKRYSSLPAIFVLLLFFFFFWLFTQALFFVFAIILLISEKLGKERTFRQVFLIPHISRSFSFFFFYFIIWAYRGSSIEDRVLFLLLFWSDHYYHLCWALALNINRGKIHISANCYDLLERKEKKTWKGNPQSVVGLPPYASTNICQFWYGLWFGGTIFQKSK